VTQPKVRRKQKNKNNNFIQLFFIFSWIRT